MTSDYAWELSKALYGIGMLSGCNGWGDTSHIPDNVNILYAVAPRPYISGTFADLLRMQSPINYLPPLEEAKDFLLKKESGSAFSRPCPRVLITSSGFPWSW